jgi:Homeodomain-like domain
MAVKGAARRVEIGGEDRAELERIARAVSGEVRMVERARIVLAASEGLTAAQIAERVGCAERTVKKWRGTESGQRRERWTHRELGEQVGISESSQAHVILSRAEIRPHRTEYWVMIDFDQPYFEERCSEVCGLYLNPPANPLVLSIDDKTSVQTKGLARPDALPARAARTPGAITSTRATAR